MQTVEAEPVCNRCGKCCTLPSGKPCKFLVRIGSQTLCRIYRNRLGAYIGEGQYCNDITDVPKLFHGCPYNAPKATKYPELQDMLKDFET